MNRILSSIIFLLLLSSSLYAQESCGTEQVHSRLMKSDPRYRAQYEKTKLDWARFQEMKALQRLIINGTDTVYEIPVVIHVIHTGGPIGSAYNPTDVQLQGLIDFTNKCYEATWPGYAPVGQGGTRVPFKFVLAKRDPDCLPTTGILRVDGSVLPNYATEGISLGAGPGADETDVKALSKWPNNQYYNIWVVNEIGNGSGVAGYAYYPGAGPAVDGTVILESVSQSGSSTLAHEIGHGMGLPHTFEGDNDGVDCPPNVDCNVDGDGICDTEPHKRGILCSETINPCTGTNMNFTQYSFMSYSGGCRDRFTPGQRDKMIFNLKNNRGSLMNSIGGVAPPPQPLPAFCVPTIYNPGSAQNAGPHLVKFVTINHASGGYTSEGAVYVDNFCTSYTEVFTGFTYDIKVQTGNFTENVRVYIDYDNDGQFQDPAELVFSSNGTMGNQLHTGTITIPNTAVVCTAVRMRVVSDVVQAAIPGPCAALAHGQAEDYVLTIKPPDGAELTQAITAGINPGCKDSLLSFEATATGIPSSNSIYWMVNNGLAGTGNSFSSTTLVDGDEVYCVTVVMNATCLTPDSIRSTAEIITHLQGPPPPFISFIGNTLVANVSPVQWYGPAGQLIPGATGQSYVPLHVGTYYARTTTETCPSEPSNILQISLLHINSLDLEQVKIYPNPADNEIILDWKGKLTDAGLSVYNSLGQLVLSQNVFQASKTVLDVTQLSSGIYFLMIKDRNGNAGTVKLQVAH